MSLPDKLDDMFTLRKEFMDMLNEKMDAYPPLPLDLTNKKSQILLRDITLKGVEEIFEALQELKNVKSHRQTDIPHFDRDAFLEENVDALNFFFTSLRLVGVTSEELYDAYVKKHQKICQRLNDGY
jgi:rhamnogalacturonyl hydrolase YesR